MSSASHLPIIARKAQANIKDFIFPSVSSFLKFVSGKRFLPFSRRKRKH